VPRVDLEAFQRDFQRRVTSPRGRDELDVYAEMYFFRLVDVIAAQHERLVTAIGRQRFMRLVGEYLREHPPRTHDVGDAGDRLPVFLATHAIGLEKPWLVDVTRLERLHVDLVGAEDARLLRLDDLSSLAPEDLLATILRTIPAAEIIDSEWDLEAAWHDPISPPRRETHLVVWRPDVDVLHRRVDEGELIPLVLARVGSPISRIAEELSGDLAPDAAARRLFSLVERWIDEGILRE
jgi:hypothetical protein